MKKDKKSILNGLCQESPSGSLGDFAELKEEGFEVLFYDLCMHTKLGSKRI